MIDLLNPNAAPHQDWIVLDGLRSPGKAYVVGAGAPRKWQRPEAYGYTGASQIFIGNPLSSFDVVLELWLDEHWAVWNDRFASLLEKVPSENRPVPQRPLSIVHPVLNRKPWSITAVVVDDVLAPEQDDEGMWTIRIKFTSWVAPKKALGKINGKIPGADAANPFASDPVISALLNKQADLGGVLGRPE